MGANRDFNALKHDPQVSLNDTLTAGITKSDASKPISEISEFNTDGSVCKLVVKVNELSVASASSAALAWGEHIFSFPAGIGLVEPLVAHVKMLSTTDAAQAATAGEIGLGSVIATGANATLGAVGATSEDIMEGTTIANHVADTELTTEEMNRPVAFGDHGAAGMFGLFDCSASAVDVHLNLATTYDNASTAATVFSAEVVLWYRVLGENFGKA